MPSERIDPPHAKGPGRPLIEPAEAIAIALSMVPLKSTGHICSPDSAAVRLILQSLKLAGYKIEPR